ncbi:MAG: phytase [Cyanobacteria bacterium P01_A01_bin.68]
MTNQDSTVLNNNYVITPTLETLNNINEEDAEQPALRVNSEDPAIWLNPTNPEESIVIGALKNGDLATFNLQGEVEQVISAIELGDIGYKNIDIIYDFPLASMIADEESKVDLAIASDRANNTLAIFEISSDGQLNKLSTPQLDNPVTFGVDNVNEAIADGLATYTSSSGKSYVFLTQADGNKVAQIELISRLGPADEQLIEAETVRTLELPVLENQDVEDAQLQALFEDIDVENARVQGLTVDRELGFLYIATQREGILKISAEPEDDSDFTVVKSSQPITEFITFGDSLADVGNLFLTLDFLNIPTSPAYSDGRLSNGKLVPEIIAEELGLSASTPSIVGGNNYAFVGAKAGFEVSSASDSLAPSVGEQITEYLNDNQPKSTDVFFISAGSNDLADIENSGIPTEETVVTAVDSFTQNITTLADKGAKNFIIPNLAPLGRTPEAAIASGLIPGIENILTNVSSQFNALLDTELDELEDELEINIIELDTASEIASILDNPNEFGLTNVLTPAYDTENTISVPNPEDYFWWDTSHPTTAAYSLIAKEVIDKTPELYGLVPDVEDLSIYYGADGTGYLIASSQSDSSYSVFTRGGDNEYLGSFVVGENDDDDIDKVNEIDGLDVTNVALGSEFPNGLLVVQDGEDTSQNLVEDDEELENNTNFKFVPWDTVANAFDNPLQIDTTSYSPRKAEDKPEDEPEEVISLDNTPPTITGNTTPIDNATNIAIDQNISFTFSEDVTAVPQKNITITDEDSNVIKIAANDTTQVAIANGTVTINPNADLINGKQYTIEIESGAFTDTAGNAFDGKFTGDGTFNFTTIDINTSSQPQPQPQSFSSINISNQDTSGNDIELIDLSAYSNQTVTANFEITREATYSNNVYFYEVDNANGEIGSLAPNTSGYLQAALNNVINPSNGLTTADGQTTTGTLEMIGGNMLGVLIVAEGTLSEARSNLDSVEGVYFSYIGANTDDGNFDHIKFEDNMFKFEDLANGGDQDFNDIEIRMEFSA